MSFRLFPLLLFILSKVLIFAWAFLLPRLDFGDVSWLNWDANIYVEIVTHGYTFRGLPVSDVSIKDSIAFFPLYPLCMRLLTLTGLSPVTAGLLLSSLFTLLTALLLYDLCLRWRDEKVAVLATFFFLFAPGSVFLHAVYTESLFVLLVMICLRGIYFENWVMAGIGLGLATVTRIPGIALYPALAVAMFQKRPGVKKVLVAFLISIVPLALFLFYQKYQFGTPFAFLEAQERGWNRHLDWPWVGLRQLWSHIPQYSTFAGDLAVFIVMFVLSIVGARRIPLPFLAYLFGILALAICTSWPMSVTRICLVALPFYLLVADLLASTTALWLSFSVATFIWSQIGATYYLLRRLFL